MGKIQGKKSIGNSVPSNLQIKVVHLEMIIMFHEMMNRKLQSGCKLYAEPFETFEI